MNKKRKHVIVICIVCAVCIAAFVAADYYPTPYGWERVGIGEFGSIAVPGEWEHEVIDGFMYFYTEENGERNNILVQSVAGHSINHYFDNINKFVLIDGQYFSNSAFIDRKEVFYSDGFSTEMFILTFTGPVECKPTEFICLDSSITEKTIVKIAKSFKMT